MFQLIGLLIILLLYRKSCKLYKLFKIFNLSSQYREVVEILDLFVLLLTISHIFVLMLIYSGFTSVRDYSTSSRKQLDDQDKHREIGLDDQVHIFALFFMHDSTHRRVWRCVSHQRYRDPYHSANTAHRDRHIRLCGQ